MMTIQMTTRAARQVRDLLDSKQETAGFGLRVGVDTGGCKGNSYTLALAAKPDADDLVIKQDGFEVFINPSVAPMLHGVRIDYVESIASSGFTFDNPNASGSCGCGSSFSVCENPEEETKADRRLFEQVEEAMQQIRPYLQADGGDVELVDVHRGVVTVQLTGACMGCGAALGTLGSVIERRLKEVLPEVERVQLAPPA